MVIRWKKNLAKFENEQYKSGLASGEFLLVHGYSGDILQAQAENPDIAFALPAEGTLDLLRRPGDPARTRRQSTLAHAFINFLHDPAVAAENTRLSSATCARTRPPIRSSRRSSGDNPAVMLDPAVQAKCEVIRDLGADNAKYTKVWDQIKAAP